MATTRKWHPQLADLKAHRASKDFRYRTSNDVAAEIHASVSGVPRFDADGAFLGYRGTATDITAPVRAEREAARAHEVLIRLLVAGTGVGMLPEVTDRAFEPFFTTKAAGSGTGLGLSMVYGFIKQSGGYIDIESKLGQGTTIMMHLPRTSKAQKKPAKP